MKVYLAGPIELCSDDEVHIWRDYVCDRVPESIEIIQPKYHLGTAEDIFNNTTDNVEECDIVFAYLPRCINERRASYGTIFEISYGFALGKRVLIISDDEYVQSHPVMKGAATEYYQCIDSALLAL